MQIPASVIIVKLVLFIIAMFMFLDTRSQSAKYFKQSLNTLNYTLMHRVG